MGGDPLIARRARGATAGGARRAFRGSYPQVDPGAAGLIDAAVVPVPVSATVGQALALARRRDAAAVVTAEGEDIVLRDDLVRAASLGLADLAAADLTWPVPSVDANVTEVTVRRLVAAGAPLVVVRRGARVLGAVHGTAAGLGALVTSPLPVPLARLTSPATRALLRQIGALAEAAGGRAFLVGGVVRDVVAGGRVLARRDLDVVVEGDGLGVARRLAAERGAALVEHGRFLTASVQDAREGRIDIATARSERYEVPGALPRVMPSGILPDLRRRDFAVNAMAVELSSGAFGLLDPVGGRPDLRRRRLRALHPLSFVEDPTRMFRAARYAARLGFGLDIRTRRSQALALRLAPYPALSGQRIAAELELILAEGQRSAALRHLGTAGVLRLLDEGYRFTRRTAARLALLDDALGWASARGLSLAPLPLALLILLGDQPADVAERALGRLGVTGDPAARLLRGLGEGAAALARLGSEAGVSALVRALGDRTPVELAWLWLVAGARDRAALDRVVARGPVRPWLRGDELIGLGVRRGPEVARMLDELRDAQLDGAIADRAGAVAHVRRRLEGTGALEDGGGHGGPGTTSQEG
jgi:hypothetical protein